MEENHVGFRLHPTDEESINHFLKNKVLGDLSKIEAIGEININDHDPYSLLSLSRSKPDDPTGYFFAPVIYTSATKKFRKRTTVSGSWGPSGEDRVIRDKEGNTIGLKKTLVYHERGASKSKREENKNTKLKVKKNTKVKVKKKKNPWVIHEYCSHPNLDSYVFCKIKYKGEDGETSQSLASDSNTVTLPGEPSQSLASDPNTVTAVINTPPEGEQQLSDEQNGLSMNVLATPMIEQERAIINTPPEGEQQLSDEENCLSLNDLPIPIIEQENLDDLFNLIDGEELEQQEDLPEVYDEFFDGFDPIMFFKDNLQPQTLSLPQDNDQELIMQEHRNAHKPRKPLAGIIVDSDDDDAESISVTSYQGTLSPGGDSVGSDSSNTPFSSDIDEEETLSSSIDVLISSADFSISRENTESQLTPRIIPSEQEVNEDIVIEKKKKKSPHYVIGLILLVAFIGTIVSVLSTVET